jgi:class 3 adenylate cyclase
MQARTAALATSPGIAEAAARFADAYDELSALDSAVIDETAPAVVGFYRDTFAPALTEITGSPVSWRSLVPVGPAAIYLQRYYVAGDEPPIAEPELIDDAEDGSTWSAVHQEFHLGALDIVERVGAEDLYLVEPEEGNIVYSVAKKPDFATSLDLGPYGGSTLAAVVRSVRDAPERGVVTVIDMAPYGPALGVPSLFMASPVFDGSDLVSILVIEIPAAALDAIMTSEGNWVAEGLGETGETYLVGPDGRMRSEARPLVERPDSFVAELADAGTATKQERTLIAATGTTAMFLKVADGRELAAVARSDEPTRTGTNYLVQPVVSATTPLDFADLGWFVVAETERGEIDGPIVDYRRALLIAIAVFVIAITFGTAAWARGVFRPLRDISEKLRRVHEGEEPDSLEAGPRAPSDLIEVSQNVDEMLGALRRREAALEAASADRLDTVRSLLPEAIAERVEAGDRNVIDRVPQAGIVVLVIGGIGEMLRSQETGRTRELLNRVVEELDSVARYHGLERVKLVGDAYFAGCGLSQPFLDSAPRSVGFAMDAFDVIREAGEPYNVRPGAAAGIHIGPVNVGLTGSARLVYDLWGETVNTAVLLARFARMGEILVTDTVKELLPTDFAVEPRAEAPGTAPVWTVTGHLASRGQAHE